MSLNIKQCFTKEGSLAKGNIPCDPDAEASTCCGPGSTCMENYYCKDSNGYSVPGTCTDQLWGARAVPNPACPCQSHFRTDGSVLNYVDSITFCADGSICCGISNFDCCNAGKGNPIIKYGNDAVIPTVSATTALSSYYSGLQVTTVPLSSRTASSKSTGTVTNIGMSASASAIPTENLVQNGNEKLSSGAKIAIGVSIGVIAFLIVLVLVFWLIFWKRYKRMKSQVESKEWSPAIMGRFEVPADNVIKRKPLSAIHPALKEKHEYVKDERKKSWMVWARNSKPVELGDYRTPDDQ